MRWKQSQRRNKPFLVLPSIDTEMPKNSSLKLFTKTWPPKTKNEESDVENRRPLTATLEKPIVLDIKYIGKLDMSLMRKEFMSLTNLCKLPLNVLNVNKVKRCKNSVQDRKLKKVMRPLSLPSQEKKKKKKPVKLGASDDSWEDVSSRSSEVQSAKKVKNVGKNCSQTEPKNLKASEDKNDANNNSKTFKEGKKRGNRKFDKDKPLVVKSMKLPEPCKTCGRPDQPERFHSHPETNQKPKITKKVDEVLEKIPVKNIVQKPVAIKYKPKKFDSKESPKETIRKKSPLPAQKILRTPPATANIQEELNRRPVSGKVPKMLTCYICGREFGTASLPLHEPKCLQVSFLFFVTRMTFYVHMMSLLKN